MTDIVFVALLLAYGGLTIWLLVVLGAFSDIVEYIVTTQFRTLSAFSAAGFVVGMFVVWLCVFCVLWPLLLVPRTTRNTLFERIGTTNYTQRS